MKIEISGKAMNWLLFSLIYYRRGHQKIFINLFDGLLASLFPA